MKRSRSSDKDAGMKVRKENAKKLLDGSKHFVIPYFQRAYVWDEEKWERFLEDIETIMDREYFMGFIVLKEDDSAFDKEYDVIDGQQRLTTFYLFARALCEVNEENLGLIDFYPLDDDEQHPTLYHNHNDKPIFDIILKDDPLDSRIEKAFQDNKVLACYKYFLSQEDRIKEIDLENVLKYLSFGCMYLTEYNDEQKIFDTMNSLGEPLRTSDLLKNELFSKHSVPGEKSEELYEKTWKIAFEKDGEVKKYWDSEIPSGRNKQTNLDVLLRAYLEIKNPDSNVYKKHDSIFKRYKELLKKPEIDKEKFIHELMDYAEEYRKYIDAECLDKEMSNELLTHRLNVIMFSLGMTLPIPYILYILKEVDDEDEKKRIFEVLESYLMRRLITGSSTKNYNNYFMRSIAGKKNTCEILKALVYGDGNALESEMPTETALKESLKSKKLANGHARVILYFLEHHAKPTEAATAILPPNAYSVEHVMPKKWIEHWQDNLPEGENAKEERNQIIFTLGNLIIITPRLNSQIRHANWENKKNGREAVGKKKKMHGLKDCCQGLATFAKYLPEADWSEETIQARAEYLFEIAKDLWKYDPPA